MFIADLVSPSIASAPSRFPLPTRRPSARSGLSPGGPGRSGGSCRMAGMTMMTKLKRSPADQKAFISYSQIKLTFYRVQNFTCLGWHGAGAGTEVAVLRDVHWWHHMRLLHEVWRPGAQGEPAGVSATAGILAVTEPWWCPVWTTWVRTCTAARYRWRWKERQIILQEHLVDIKRKFCQNVILSSW